MEMRGKNSRRERSPERGRTSSVQMHEAARGSSISTRMIKASPPPPCFKKVQVVYYLSKNGQLEHPHFMEVTHLAHHHLRLKDVMDRLTVLRGRGMPSLYSWSYKRSYRNGYVWNDLAENDDIICPAGTEYVLKGSQLLETTYTENYQHPVAPQVVLLPDSNTYHSKRKTVPSKRHDELIHNKSEDDGEEDYYDVKTTYTAPNTPYSRCSIGVSTDEIELEQQQNNNNNNKITHVKNNYLSSSSPSACTSSSISEKAVLNDTTTTSKSDPVGTDHSMLSPHSVLYNLIACGGGSVSFRGKSNKVPFGKENEEKKGRTSSGSSSSSLVHNKAVVVCKSVKAVEDDDDDEDEIRCMSENPRFGNPQSEEKEYFSGSIVDAMCEDERVKVVPAVLRKSSSHNEERSCKAGVDVVGEEKEMMKEREKDGSKGKCIPRSKKSSTSCLSSFI